ncbi:MAG: ATP-binding cassette domain-containing protein [Candidatus Cloacimonetes bacterium]|nr:ATP-binding cassette domain-containing protein [Candidatus Cloacimonadota bacterium]
MIELKEFVITGAQEFRLKADNLQIKSGLFIQINGSNNSGKSLLLKTLAGLYSDFEGELYYNGVKEKPGNYSVILINNFAAVLPKKSVKYNLNLPLGKTTARKTRILLELLKDSGLDKCLDYKLNTLSDSQIKILELIRAIIQQPHFLLIDDFDTYFDNVSLDNLTKAFDHAAKAGTAIVITTRKKFEGITNSYTLKSGEIIKQ